jgi:hypothetical protein
MGVDMESDRRGSKEDNGARRRGTDPVRERDDFLLFRDKLLLTIGSVGVLGIGLAAIFLPIRNTEIALAALTVFATCLGLPGIVKLDQRAARRRSTEDT